MCKCVDELSAKVIEMKKEENKDVAIIGEGNFAHMGLSMSGKGGWRTYQEFEYEFTPIKKNGTQGRQFKKRVSVYHSYCPFCGKKIDNYERSKNSSSRK